MNKKVAIGVLVSGSGSNLQSIIDQVEAGNLDATINVVISNVPNVLALERAQKHNIPTELIDHRNFETRDDFAKLYALVCLLREKRMASGASAAVPELQVRVDSNKEVSFKLRDRETKSQVVVSECMIHANFCASLLFKEKRFPTLFRKQKPPSQKAEGERPTR